VVHCQPDITKRALVVILLVYDVSVRCHGVDRSLPGDFDLISSFHLFNVPIPFDLFFPIFHLVFLVFLSSVLIQLIRSCGGYFSVTKGSSSRAAYASSSSGISIWPDTQRRVTFSLSSSNSECFWIFLVNIAFYCPECAKGVTVHLSVG
jgi:hypothetical protein